MKRFAFVLVLIGVCFFNLYAEDAKELSLPDQYRNMVDHSNTYNEYKVIKAVHIEEFFKTLKDSLGLIQRDIATLRNTISEKDGIIASLMQELAEIKEYMALSESEKMNLTVLGIEVNKNRFVFLFWISLISLLGILGFTVFKYTESHKVTRKTIRDFDELNTEFLDYKQRSIEKERKLRRELQTERNVLEEMLEKQSADKVTSIRKA
ncbi:MAG: hypothetical protein JJU28_10040 [Cyclobacteriaceae bacterium]|nr:hypothetical protein [Cyclobacteriaceae bacterium]